MSTNESPLKFNEKSSFIYRAWRYRLLLDRAELAWVRRILKAGDVAIDIGTHKGAYSYWMSKAVGETGLVYAFEPQKKLVNKLNRILPVLSPQNILLHHMGLSSKPGQKDLFIPGAGSVTTEATLESPKDPDTGQLESVSVGTLDDVLANEKRPISLIKCDVEGHELDVFKGAEKVLRKNQPALLFECEARHRPGGSLEPVFNFLNSIGYAGHFFLHGQLKPIQEFHSDLQQVGRKPYVNNFLFQV